MLFWSLVGTLGVVLPLILVVVRRNVWTFLMCYAPFFLLAFIDASMKCRASRVSEACTWSYMNYFYAMVVGSFIYLLVTAVQWGWHTWKARRQ